MIAEQAQHKKIKLEKVEQSVVTTAQQERSSQKTVGSTNEKLKVKIRRQDVKRGMEVAIRSPNSMCVAAMGTVQNADDNNDYVEVLINLVVRKTTRIPGAKGKVKDLANAQSKCIFWPRINVRNVPLQNLYYYSCHFAITILF